MLDIVLFLTFCVISWRTFFAVRRERDVFVEFGQSPMLGALVLLYPLAWPMSWAAGLAMPPLVAWAVAALCFLPGGWLARRQMKSLERCGTSRADAAEAVAANAAGYALLGLVILVLRIATVLGLAFLHHV